MELPKKDLFKLRKRWKQMFAPDLRGDWKVLLSAGASFDDRALADYTEAEGESFYLWTEANRGWQLESKPQLSVLLDQLMGLEPQAVYLTQFDGESPWSLVVYLDDHTLPLGYVFYRALT